MKIVSAESEAHTRSVAVDCQRGGAAAAQGGRRRRARQAEHSAVNGDIAAASDHRTARRLRPCVRRLGETVRRAGEHGTRRVNKSRRRDTHARRTTLTIHPRHEQLS